MILTNPDIQTNLLDIKKIKYYNTKMNLEVEKEKISTEEPLTNYYQYQCTTHLNYIFRFPLLNLLKIPLGDSTASSYNDVGNAHLVLRFFN